MKTWLVLVVLILACACAPLASMLDGCTHGRMLFCSDSAPCVCLPPGMALPGVP